ncbi:hypothetical protein L1987_71710 [Smallanthus sonchifolius]|uniref:Uncharacterized protein n=1 Tax=Smallanthus sonchifolius TaxID=185202 RepID=A0ACB9ATU1_9ASTR|nr:hypothetical protein L1987_71710 [Smallanthus sonchifolius]
MGWAIRVGKKMGIRVAAFCPASATTLATTLCFHRLIDDGIISDNGMPLDGKMIQFSETMAPIKSTNLWWARYEDSAMVEAAFQIVVDTVEVTGFADWIICNSTTELEPEVFSLYSQVSPIGPLLASNRLADQAGQFWEEDSTCLSWLDQQPTCSVIYIAFGSFAIFNQTQFEELALGLELSNRPFLWVVSPGMTKETTAYYPDGYMDRVGSRGRIVSWTPQQKIGLGFNKDESGIITRGEIKSKIEHPLNDKALRATALDVKENVASSLRNGGSSHRNLSSFMEWIQEKDTN